MTDDASRSLRPADPFPPRHLGPSPEDLAEMLAALGLDSLEALVDAVVPAAIRCEGGLDLPPPRGERDVLRALEELAADNRPVRSFLGLGYHDCVTPPVLLRNLLEDPGWYTQYTPYQAEISQGRMELLLAFQTAMADLTGLPVANASLLDEATAAAEAMAMCLRLRPRKSRADAFAVADDCHPQTIAVVQTRAAALGIDVRVGPRAGLVLDEELFGCLVQVPATDGRIVDVTDLCKRAHAAGAKVVVACDPLALTLLRPPGECGADVVVGSAQRLGVPLGWGGPHAAFLTTRAEHVRQVPGRIIGVSRDAAGRPALRMALQTREQHIRRHRATSNICTAQVLLAIVSGAYAIHHGPEGLAGIARRVHRFAEALATGLRRLGHEVAAGPRFDTVRCRPAGRTEAEVLAAAAARGLELRGMGDGSVCVAFDETVTGEDLSGVLAAFGDEAPDPAGLVDAADGDLPEPERRTSPFLTDPLFSRCRSETELLRLLTRLRNQDLSLAHAMIPLGSCTMKLNATAEMAPITWPGFAGLHPFTAGDNAGGYHRLLADLERWLSEITGFDAISFQPNAGSQGELSGLLVIRAWHEDRGEATRDVCLIPDSAHGTNPASAVMAGLRVVTVRCDGDGNIDVADLAAKAEAHASRLAALMVTYPSTHGVFEEAIREVCAVVHRHGGQVYLDGANLNAMVGLCRAADLGADVCHLNLHKTFAIPHGGGGPGMGPIGVRAHLAPYLPGHPLVRTGGERAIGAVAAAPFGSPSILPISWAYIALMGGAGLTEATRVAICNANYVAHRLAPHYPVLYTGRGGLVAHECIIDVRPLQARTGVTAEDVAKRLMDYGFHAPTVSFPVAGTLMIEPTESESRAELDAFCEALVLIREEIRAIEEGRADRDDNPLKGAPHTAREVSADDWSHAYSRREAAWPAPFVAARKFWPPVGRIDNAFGDRNLVLTLPEEEEA